MALEQYSDQFWFKTGSLAANVPAYIFAQNSSIPAVIYRDAAGTIQAPNPLPTDLTGTLTFYALVGEYWIHISDQTFQVNVGLSQEQADLSTGIASGGELDVAGAQSVLIHPLVGYVVDNSSVTSVKPNIVKIDYAGATVSLSGASLTRTITWWLLDSAKNVIQQSNRPTATQRRTHLILGASIFDINTLILIEVQTLPVILPQLDNQFVDLVDALGPFSITGNIVSANGANLSINKTAGTLFARAFNLFVNGVVNDDPHVSSSAAQTPVTLRRITQLPQITTPPLVTTLDPTNYDVGGVITPVGGGANSSTIQRVWLFAANTVSLQIAVQYGQTVYNSLAAATAAIGAGTFIPAPVTSDAALIGFISLTRTATDLSNPTQATFVHAGKFATP